MAVSDRSNVNSRLEMITGVKVFIAQPSDVAAEISGVGRARTWAPRLSE